MVASDFDALYASVYPVRVLFKRTFTSGALNGLTVDDSIRFPTVESALSWIHDTVGHPEIHDAHIEEI